MRQLTQTAKESQMKSKPSKTATPDTLNRNVDGQMGFKKYSNNQGSKQNKAS